MRLDETNRTNSLLLTLFISAATILLLQSCERAHKISNPQNHRPDIPSSPFPADGSVSQAVNSVFSWQCIDPDGDSLKYDIFFGSQSNPLLAVSGLTQRTYNPGPLEFNSAYYWRVAAVDTHQDTSLGPIWTFSTLGVTGLIFIGSCPLDMQLTDLMPIAVSTDNLLVANADSNLYVIDISNPSSPNLASRYEAQNPIIDIELSGQTAYLAENGANAGLEIVDISNPATPNRISIFHGAGSVTSIDTRGNYAFVCGRRQTSAQIFTLNVADPMNPILVDSCDGSGVVRLIGDHAYTLHGCDFEEVCLGIYELGDNYSLSLVNSVNLHDLVFNVAIDSRYLAFINNWNEAFIWSLTPLSNPNLIYVFPDIVDGGYGDLFLNGDVLYAAVDSAGEYSLRMISITDIFSPLQIAKFTASAPLVKVYVANGYLYLIDVTPSLLVLGYES